MALESIEREALRHLKEVSNPLVPLSTLVAHLQSDGTLGDISATELERFLRKHELFRVLDPPGFAADPESRDELGQLGLTTEPFVILDTRMPGPNDITAALVQQVDGMASALVTAAREARDKNDDDRLAKIETMLKRVETVRKKIISMA